jgi:hypothetical protein
MTNVRIKDLTSATPDGTEAIPFDSASPGTRQNTITNVVDVGNQTINNPIIGVSNIGNVSTVRTQLISSGVLTAMTGATISGSLWTILTSSFGRVAPTTLPSDTFFYVSGNLNQFPSNANKKAAVFSIDTIFSGTIMLKSSSANPVNVIINGNGDGGMFFSGSLLSLASSAGVQIGGITGQGAVVPIAQADTIFFISGSIGGKDGSSRTIAVVGSDLVVSGNMFAYKSASFTDTVIVPTPATGTAAANRDYADYPSVRVVSTATDTLTVNDFGKIVAYTLSSSIIIGLNNSLTASFPTNKEALILMQFEHSASIPIISASGGATLNGSTTAIYTGSVGYGFVSIGSRNGLNWFR